MTKLPSSETHTLSPGGQVVRKATVDGYGVVQDPPSAGAGTQPRQEGGQYASSQYQGGTADPFFRQDSPDSEDDSAGTAPSGIDAPGVDREASASHGPGRFGNFAVSTPITKYPIHVKSPMARMVAGGLLRQTVSEFDTVDGQPVAVARYHPAVRPDSLDLSPPMFQACLDKVNAVTHAFHAQHGRFPAVGSDLDADDAAYVQAFDAILTDYYGSPTGNVIP